MIRVHVICEGQTEEMFVNEVLAPSLATRQVYLRAILIGKPGHKGGNVRFERLRGDIEKLLLGDKTAYCSTFFDFYGLPSDFVGKQESLLHVSAAAKARHLQHAMQVALTHQFGVVAMRRFIPYVQMYEFEALLFSDPVALAREIGSGDLTDALQKVRADFASPEEINNSPDTAPSKRIAAQFPSYDKVFHGSLVSLEIGLAVIRQECKLFDAWLKQIEALAD